MANAHWVSRLLWSVGGALRCLGAPGEWLTQYATALDERRRIRFALPDGMPVRVVCPHACCESDREGQWLIGRYDYEADDYRLDRREPRAGWPRPDITFAHRANIEVVNA